MHRFKFSIGSAVRKLKTAITFGFLLASVCSYVAAQQPAAALSPAQQAANQLFVQSKWEEAAQAFLPIANADPKNGPAWQNLGECYMQMEKFDQAIPAFAHNVEVNFRPLINQVNLARAYAAKGDAARGIKLLKEVAANPQGARAHGYILSSSEFATLRKNPEYLEVLAATSPCNSPEYHQFDFWVGDWEVHGVKIDQVVGHNLVTREQDGCLIIEHWTGNGGSTGTSFNYWDIRDKMWHQLYLDNSGNAGAFPAMAGNFQDGKIVLISDVKASPVFRWTWYVMSPGHVKQKGEQSDDGQKTWTTIWDSVYVAKPGQSGK